MTNALSKVSGLPFFTDLYGNALDVGEVFIGQPNTDPRQNPITVYYDEAQTIPAPQPIKTLSGRLSRTGAAAEIFVNPPYSIYVQDQRGAQVYYLPYVDDPIVSAIGALTQISLTNIAALRLVDHTKNTRAIVFGYYALGDGGGGAYYYDPTDTISPDNGGTVIVDAANGRWKLSHPDGAVSVKQFGAKGDGVTDDAASIQAAMNWVQAVGGILRITAAVYVVKTTLTLNLSTLSSFATTGGVTIVGDGSANTELRWGGATATPLLNVIGNLSTAPLTQCNFSGFKLTATAARVGYGIQFQGGAYNKFRDVLVYGLDIGWNLTDFLSSEFNACHMFLCNTNIKMQFGSYSGPNAILFNQCVIGTAINAGAVITGGAGVTFNGGSFENNGNNGANGLGVQIVTPGANGGVAATFNGVYFEGNGHLADIYLLASTSGLQTTLALHGCNFNRVDPVIYSINNIRVDSANTTDSETTVVVTGCSFHDYNAYVPSSANRNVVFNGPGKYRFVDNGSYYSSLLEKPPYITTTPFAQVTFTGASGAIRSSNNVTGVVRNSTGNYTITFGETGTAEYLVKGGSVGTQAIFFVSSEASNSITVQFAVPSTGVAVDPTAVMIEVSQ